MKTGNGIVHVHVAHCKRCRNVTYCFGIIWFIRRLSVYIIKKLRISVLCVLLRRNIFKLGTTFNCSYGVSEQDPLNLFEKNTFSFTFE